jgi:hypothetical protein
MVSYWSISFAWISRDLFIDSIRVQIEHEFAQNSEMNWVNDRRRSIICSKAILSRRHYVYYWLRARSIADRRPGHTVYKMSRYLWNIEWNRKSSIRRESRVQSPKQSRSAVLPTENVRKGCWKFEAILWNPFKTDIVLRESFKFLLKCLVVVLGIFSGYWKPINSSPRLI